MICKTCKWFDPYPELVDPADDDSNWEGEPPARGLLRWGTCKAMPSADDTTGGKPGSRAYTSDASGYRSWFTVQQDFGCIEHEEKR